MKVDYIICETCQDVLQVKWNEPAPDLYIGIAECEKCGDVSVQIEGEEKAVGALIGMMNIHSAMDAVVLKSQTP